MSRTAAFVATADGVYSFGLRDAASVRMFEPRVKPPVGSSIYEVVLTRDEKALYIPATSGGLYKLDLKSSLVTQIHRTPLAAYAGLAADGRLLYVAYRGGGPGGSRGHDAIGVFDVGTGNLLRTITGLATVGSYIRASPDGQTIWANGLDACSSAAYDHIGCPAVPAGIINVLDAATYRPIRSISFPGPFHPDGLAFSPEGSLAVVSGDALMIFNAATTEMLRVYPRFRTRDFIFSEDGTTGYATIAPEGVAKFRVDCGSR
ncbi:MAG TPA: hypothetical protein VFL57_19215 [Bryobacteraceae bacterium]|nr:hypothetical protein [Bryobacteraceae bacterium]